MHGSTYIFWASLTPLSLQPISKNGKGKHGVMDDGSDDLSDDGGKASQDGLADVADAGARAVR